MQEGNVSGSGTTELSKEQRRAEILARVQKRQAEQRQAGTRPISQGEKKATLRTPPTPPTLEDDDPFSQLLRNRDTARFDKIIQEQHPNGKTYLQNAFKKKALLLVLHPTSDHEIALETAFTGDWFPKKSLPRCPNEQPDHAQLIGPMLDRLASIYSPEELCELALAVDENGQNALILSCYTGNQTLIERVSRFYLTGAQRREAAAQTLVGTSINAFHIISACGSPGSFSLLAKLIGSAGTRQACSDLITSTRTRTIQGPTHSLEGLSALHCCYLTSATTTEEGEELKRVVTQILDTLGNQLAPIVLQNKTDRRCFLLPDSFENDRVLTDRLLASTEAPLESEIVNLLYQHLPQYYFEQGRTRVNVLTSPRRLSRGNTTPVQSPHALSKSKLLPIILDCLSTIETATPSQLLVALILCSHLKLDKIPSDLEKKCLQYCRTHKEPFAKALIELNRVLSLKNASLNFQMVGDVFSNNCLLRAMIISTFDLVDASIVRILAQWSASQSADVAKLKNLDGQTLVEALLLRLANSKYTADAIVSAFDHFCAFAGPELVSKLTREFDQTALSLMSILAIHSNLHGLTEWAQRALGDVEFKRQLTTPHCGVLRLACQNFNAQMLCYLDHQLDSETIGSFYPNAQNILHAFLLELANNPSLNKEGVLACLTAMIEIQGSSLFQKHVEQPLADGRTVLHLIAQFPAFNVTLPLFEAQSSTQLFFDQTILDATTGKEVIRLACTYQNFPLLYRCINALTAGSEPFDLQTLAAKYPTPIHYICATSDIAAFRRLREIIGSDNIKALIDSLAENIFNLICEPTQPDSLAIKKIFNNPWSSESVSRRLPRQDNKHCSQQRDLLIAITTLYDSEEINRKAIASSMGDNNIIMLSCCLGDPIFLKQVLALYPTPESRLAACEYVNRQSGATALHIASAFCSVDMVKTILSALGNRAQMACANRVEAFGHQNALHCCYLSTATTEAALLAQGKVVFSLCEALSDQLVDAVIRPLTKPLPSLIQLSTNQDKVIITVLKTLKISPSNTDFLMELSRGNAHSMALEEFMSQPSRQYVSTSPNMTHARGRRGSTAPLPVVLDRASKTSPRKNDPELLTAYNSVPDAEGQNEIISLFSQTLGLQYPADLLAKILTRIREAYLSSSSVYSASASLIVNTVSLNAFEGNEPLSHFATIVLASHCPVSDSSSLGDHFIKACREKLQKFLEILPHLLEKLTAESPPLRELFLQLLLSGRSLLRKAIVTCLDMVDEEMQNPADFLAALKQKSIRSFEEKLETYITVVDQFSRADLVVPNPERMGINLLQALIEELSTYEMTEERRQATVQFMRTFLQELKAKDALQILATHQANDGQNALHYLADRPTLNFLVAVFKESLDPVVFSKLVVSAVNRENETALHVACRKQNVLCLTETLAGTLPSELDPILKLVTRSQGYTLLDMACQSQNPEIVIAIIKAIATKMPIPLDCIIQLKPPLSELYRLLNSDQGRSIPELVSAEGNTILLFFLHKLAQSRLSEAEMRSEFALFYASVRRPLLQKLILEPNNQTQETVMHVLAREKTLSCLLDVFPQDFDETELCQLFTPAGAHGETPLHTAVRYAHRDFLGFCRRIAGMKFLQMMGMLPSHQEGYTVFHLIPHSCFTTLAFKLKSILEGHESFPDQSIARDIVSGITISDTVRDLFRDLLALYGEIAPQLLQQNDHLGNNVLTLFYYLNDPELIHLCICTLANEESALNNTTLTSLINQPLRRTLITPVQLVSAFGSADSLRKMMSMLDAGTVRACLDVNEYLGRNALACCYLSAIDLRNEQQRAALQEVLDVFMNRIPEAFENALLDEMRYDITPVLSESVQGDQWIARRFILQEGTLFQRVQSTVSPFSRPTDLMIDILFDPSKRRMSLTPLAKPLQQAPPHLSIYAAPADNPKGLMPCTALRKSLLKHLFLFPFIPDALVEALVTVVTTTRLQLQTSNRRSILVTLLLEHLEPTTDAKAYLNSSINQFACLLLGLWCPVSDSITEEEAFYCQRFMENPDRSLQCLQNFVHYLDSEVDGAGAALLSQIYQSNSLLKQAIIEPMSEKDLRTEKCFLTKLEQITQSSFNCGKK